MSETTSGISSMQPLPTSEPRSGSTEKLTQPVGEGVSAPSDKDPTVISSRAPMDMAVTARFPTPVPGERLAPGARVSHFELLECVGGGGMGRVFRARDTALGRTVAVKVLSDEQAADCEVVLRFRNEAQTAARLNHENIVQVYHCGEESGVPYIVFEFIEGLNIRALIGRKGTLSLSEAMSYTYQVAEALAHAAAQGVIHRDIKPSNILITDNGHAKLIDLGLARLHKIGDGAGDLTASGVTLGTFDYISPEQARDPRTADIRSDIYSLGCTLFFMLAGRPPFVEGTVLQKLLQHQGEEPPDVRQFRPELPPETSHLLRRMMAKDPRRRFQSPQQLLGALAQLADEVGLQPAGPGEKAWVPEQQPRIPFLERHLPWMAPALVLGVAVLVLHVLWSGPAAPTDPSPYWLGVADESSVPPEPRSGSAVEAPSGTATSASAGSAAGPAKTDAESVPGTENEPRPKAPSEASVPSPPSASPIAASVPQGTKAPDTTPATAGSEAPAGATPGGGPRPTVPGLSTPEASAALAGLGAGGPRGAASPSPPAATGAIGSPAPSSGSPKVGAGTGVLVVDPVGPGVNCFPTLAAACAAANTGDVIVLRFNGPRQESPIALRNCKLTIRAAEGYQPVVVFRPAEVEPSVRSNAMLSLSGSQLTLVSVALAMEVPREAASDQWSLLESRPAEMIRLEKCLLSISNTSAQLLPYHPDVAFFRVRAGPGAGSLLPRDSAAAPQRVSIALVDCILRGEAVALCAHDLWPIQFSWENGLLVTSERLVVASGGERTVLPGESIQIALQHVTAVVRGGLCRFVSNASAPRMLNAQVDCRNSILVGAPAVPLVEHVDAATAEAARQGFAWNGDRNCYEGFVAFWSIRTAGAAASAQTMSFDTWREYWGPQRENVPDLRRVQWRQLPAADRPMPSHLPADYALNPSSAPANPAIGAASDGRDAGCLFDRLPPVVWPEPASPVPAPTPGPASAPDAPKG